MKCSKSRPPLFSFSSVRLRITLLLMLGKMCALTLKTNLGVTIVCMLNTTRPEDHTQSDTVPEQEYCPSFSGLNSSTSPNDNGYSGTLNWDSTLQEMMFSAISLGSVVVLLPAGLMADRFSPKIISLVALVACALITYLSPLMAMESAYGFVASRFALGAANGFIMPSMMSIASRWFVPDERSTLNAIFTIGHQIGGILLGLTAPPLCSWSFLGGWPLVYYAYATVAIGWAMVWWMFGSNNADCNRSIKEKKLKYIAQNIAEKRAHNQSVFPWRKVLTSTAFQAVLAVRVAYTAQQKIMTFYTASFVRDVLRVDLNTNGLITSLSYAAQMISKIPISWFADYLKRRRLISYTVSVRVFQSISHLGSALCFLGLAMYADCQNVTLVVVLLTVHGLSGSFMCPGMHTSALSIAPAYSGTIYALTMFVALMASVGAPTLVSAVLQQNSRDEWSLIFSAGSEQRCCWCDFCIFRICRS